MRYTKALSLLAGIVGISGTLAYGQPKDAAPATGNQVDNTRMNKVDRNYTRATPQAQSSARADRELDAAVRKAIVSDKSLSTYAHNVKIVTRDGVVTLRGPVQTTDEKAKVSEVAQQVAGVSSVDDQLLVKTPTKAK